MTISSDFFGIFGFLFFFWYFPRSMVVCVCVCGGGGGSGWGGWWWLSYISSDEMIFYMQAMASQVNIRYSQCSFLYEAIHSYTNVHCNNWACPSSTVVRLDE